MSAPSGFFENSTKRGSERGFGAPLVDGYQTRNEGMFSAKFLTSADRNAGEQVCVVPPDAKQRSTRGLHRVSQSAQLRSEAKLQPI